MGDCKCQHQAPTGQRPAAAAPDGDALEAHPRHRHAQGGVRRQLQDAVADDGPGAAQVAETQFQACARGRKCRRHQRNRQVRLQCLSMPGVHAQICMLGEARCLCAAALPGYLQGCLYLYTIRPRHGDRNQRWLSGAFLGYLKDCLHL